MWKRVRITPNDRLPMSFEELRTLDDDVLMGYVRDGYDDALGVLFDRYHRLVLHVALRVLHDVGEAEDVMQVVFMEVYRLSVQFDPSRGTAKKWILRCAYNRSINRRKQLLRRKFYASDDIATVAEVLPTGEAGIAASHEAKQLVAQAFNSLNATQRRVIELAHFEGLSFKEIAQANGEKLGNVRHHYYRGLEKLRARLEELQKGAEIRLAPGVIEDAKA